ncbi:MAG TPA: thioredoxin domain-containing protein [Kofleriaceae bacterium]|jgi:protein-disulfide isomerase|nr:thioredoxin domain-containing protein [Kofleriaceae bacterium]
MIKISAVMFVAAIAVLGGCQHQAAGGATTPAPAGAAPAAGVGPAGAPSAAATGDHSGTVEQRLARIEDALAQNAEALDFLRKVYDQQKQQRETDDQDAPADDAVFAVNIADDVKAGQVDGPATAPVTIIKAFDFACPFCQRVSGTMEELVKEYNGKVRVVYANMLIHPPAKPAHLASCAAAKQGKYNEFKHAFWEKGFLPYQASEGKDPTSLGEGNILAIGKTLGLNTNKLKADMNSPECEARLKADMAELQKFHVNATPTFFINGKMFAGGMPKDDFKQIIDDQLKLVAASGVPAADYYTKVVLAKGEKQFRSKRDAKPGK